MYYNLDMLLAGAIPETFEQKREAIRILEKEADEINRKMFQYKFFERMERMTAAEEKRAGNFEAEAEAIRFAEANEEVWKHYEKKRNEVKAAEKNIEAAMMEVTR